MSAPEPLVPAEVDLRGMEFMPFYGDRLLGSETWIRCNPEGKVAAIRLWWRAYAHEVPASSLPDDDTLLAEYAGYGNTPSGIRSWKRIRQQALRGFVLCSDGRLYHNFLAELVLVAWKGRKESRETNDHKNERQRRWRERCRMLGERLRDAGITVPKGASLETLETLCETHLVSTETPTQASTETVGETLNPSRETHKKVTVKETVKAIATATAKAEEEQSTAVASIAAGTRRGAICALLRAARVEALPHDPLVVEWGEKGVTDDQLRLALETAAIRKPPPERISTGYFARILGDVLSGKATASPQRATRAAPETDFTKLDYSKGF